MQIGQKEIALNFGLAPMAGMTDSAFRRLVKREGGCGLVVTEMVSSEGLVRGIDRTLEYAEYTDAERPISIQIFGGDPFHMAEAARIVEQLGADIVDVNMGCPVPKIARHSAGCSLMKEPLQAASIVSAIAKVVKIPVTVKIRAGWDGRTVNAPEFARAMEGAGASAIAVHPRTAEQAYAGEADWTLVAQVVERVSVPVLGCGDCVTPNHLIERLQASGAGGVLVGRGALRNPWIFAQAEDVRRGLPPRPILPLDRARFLLDYIELLRGEAESDAADRVANRIAARASRGGPRQAALQTDPHEANGFSLPEPTGRSAAHRERWVVNKIRALGSWYTKGLENGANLRVAVNNAGSIAQLHAVIHDFFLSSHVPATAPSQ